MKNFPFCLLFLFLKCSDHDLLHTIFQTFPARRRALVNRTVPLTARFKAIWWPISTIAMEDVEDLDAKVHLAKYYINTFNQNVIWLTRVTKYTCINNVTVAFKSRGCISACSMNARIGRACFAYKGEKFQNKTC